MQYENCPNCGAKISGGLFGTSITTHATPHINRALGTNVPAHCTKCVVQTEIQANAVSAERHKSREESRNALLAEADALLPDVPLTSIHVPPSWEFEAVGMVTAQSIAGTGLFADIGSTLTDMFGMQSGMFKEKIRGGEELCRRELRLKSLNLGANAIVGVDVDYAEVGGARCMLMVCMTGTAARIENVDVLGDGASRSLRRLKDIITEIHELS